VEGSPKAPTRRLAPNPDASLPPPPKVITKSAIESEAQARDALRREFLAIQEKVKATEILIPFVFYDGTNIPGGKAKVKKGDPIWVFLERCRKVGAELGVAGAGGGGRGRGRRDNRREWARVGVDDLMCVRGEVIIPHVCLSLSYPSIPLPTRFTKSMYRRGLHVLTCRFPALRVLLLYRQWSP
jgi:protein FAM50